MKKIEYPSWEVMLTLPSLGLARLVRLLLSVSSGGSVILGGRMVLILGGSTVGWSGVLLTLSYRVGGR